MKRLIVIIVLLFASVITVGDSTRGRYSGRGVYRGTTQGQILFWADALRAWTPTETNELFWDDTNKRFGIKTGSPFYDLDVPGNLRSNDIRFNYRTPSVMVSFIFDDGNDTDNTIMLPVFSGQGEVACSAIITNLLNTGGHLTTAQLQELVDAGWEVMSHTVTHPDLTALTEAQIITELSDSKDALEGLGFTINNLVYPGNKANTLVRQVARKYYKAARGNLVHAQNEIVLDTWGLRHFNMDDHTDIATYQGYVDTAETNNTWLIFNLHDTDSDDATTMNTLIDYIQAKSIPIVTIEQGMALGGNIIDTGDPFSVSEKGSYFRTPIKIKSFTNQAGFFSIVNSSELPVMSIDTNQRRMGLGTETPTYKMEINFDATIDTSWKFAGFDGIAIVGGDSEFRIVSTDGGSTGSGLVLAQVDVSEATDFENEWALYRKTNGDGTGDGTLRISYGTNTDFSANTSKVIFSSVANSLSIIGTVNNTDGGSLDLLEQYATGGFGFASSTGFRTTYNGDTNTFHIQSGNGTTVNSRLSIQHDSGNIGIGEIAPETRVEVTGTAPYLTLHNSTEENGDGGRESRINFKGEQDGTEETTLARIEVSHDGVADDEKGKIVLSVNDGNDGDTPTDVLKISADGSTAVGDGGTTNYTQVSATGDVSFVGTAKINGLKLNTVAKTGAYTATATDDVITCGAGNQTFTIDLPAVVDGKVFYIKNVGTGTITVDANTTGGTTIDGVNTKALAQYESLQVIADASVYWAI